MEIIKTVAEMHKLSDKIRQSGKTIACVPTMGYLHEGHLSLVIKGKQSADCVVTTLFVNPTQFAPNEDFEKYPRDIDRDAKLLSEAGCDYLFAPSSNEMYPIGYNTEVSIKGISEPFEGKFRPTHFNGVATVVAKLFNAIKPHYAIFGQKDYQQTLVIKQMVSDMLVDVEIIVSPTIREEDGLAKSSRNTYLTTEERKTAITLNQALKEAAKAIEAGEKRSDKINKVMADYINNAGAFRIDYACAADANTLQQPQEFTSGQDIVLLIAAYLGKTRLIDNFITQIK